MMDDILVYGSNESGHDKRLREVLHNQTHTKQREVQQLDSHKTERSMNSQRDAYPYYRCEWSLTRPFQTESYL